MFEYPSMLLQAIAPRRLTGMFLFSALALVAPVPCQAQMAEPEETVEAQHFIWQVDSPTNTVYLLGSVHLLNEGHYPLPTVMEAAFEEAEKVVFEVDVSSGAEMDAALVLLEKAEPESGESLEEVLSPSTYEMAIQKTQELGLPFQLFRGAEPWFLSISLVASQLIALGFVPEYGIDYYFLQQAQADQKPILFLETIEEQADLFEQLSIAEQSQFVQQTLDELEVLETSFNEIVSAWALGDTDGMAELLLASFADYPEMQRIFLSDRNRNWLTQIQRYLQDDQDYLVIVGALHLVGPNSLIELLEQEGYAAEQL